MDSNQTATKKDFDENVIQNQDDNTLKMKVEGGDGTEREHFDEKLHPLQMGSMLEAIFSFLDAKSLKEARQVNKLWRVEGAKMLIAKSYVHIPLKLKDDSSSATNNTMEMFKSFLSHKSTDVSMIPNIAINNFDDPALWKSLGVLGQQVTSIKLKRFDMAAQTLNHLFDILPNLKFLNFKNLGYKADIIKSLLSVSNSDNIRSSLVISCVTLYPASMEQLETIEKFCDSSNIFLTGLRFKLPRLDARFPQIESRIVSMMTRILIKNQSILKCLNFKEGFYKMEEVIKIFSPVMSTTETNRNQLVIPFIALEAGHPEQLKYIEAFADCENIMIERLKLGSFSFANNNPNRTDRVVNILGTILTTNQNTIKILDFKDGCLKSEFIKVVTSVMSTAERNQNPLLIPRMTFEPGNLKQLADIGKFSDCKSIVTEELAFKFKPIYLFGVVDLETRIANIISKLLSTSHNSLKKLQLYDCQHYLSCVDFPKMTALTHMHLSFFTSTTVLSHLKFSRSFNFLENIPYLHEISLDYNRFDRNDQCSQNCFEGNGAAPSVKRVKYSGYDLTDRLFTTFPGIEDLEISVNCLSEKIFHRLWKNGKNLKKLNLSINLDNIIGEFAGMDSVFTGFTPETVDKIMESSNLDPFTLEEMEKLRTSPSILNLQELEHFSITFSGWDIGNFQKLMSTRTFVIAAKYGWNLLLKNPKIFIKARRLGRGSYDALDQVSKFPNVTVKFDPESSYY